MAYSYIRYNGNGSTTNFTFPFSYISRDHIVVKVNDVSTSFTFLNDSTVTVSPAPANGTIVEIRRVTPKNTPIVNFTDGSVLLEADLDLLATFDLYIAQEAEDAVEDTIGLESDNTFDAKNKRIKNVANPVNSQDAATKDYVSLALADYKGRYHGPSATPPTTNVSTGDLWFDTSTNYMRVYDGVNWLQASINTSSRQIFTATGGQTVFTLGSAYAVNLIDVFLNGVKLVNGADFTATDGLTVTLLSAASAGDILEVVSYSGFSVADVGYIGRASFTGDGSTTTFNTGKTLAGRSSVWISINGIVQHDPSYSVSGTNIVLTEAPDVGDSIQVSIFGISPLS